MQGAATMKSPSRCSAWV